MTEYARVYGGSLYDLAAEESLTDAIKDELQEIVKIFRANPEYMTLLSEPSIKKDERTKLIEDAYGISAQGAVLASLSSLATGKALLASLSRLATGKPFHFFFISSRVCRCSFPGGCGGGLGGGRVGTLSCSRRT